MSNEWNLIRLSGHPHGIVTKTVHKTLPGGGWGVVGGGGDRGVGMRVVMVGEGVVGVGVRVKILKMHS